MAGGPETGDQTHVAIDERLHLGRKVPAIERAAVNQGIGGHHAFEYGIGVILLHAAGPIRFFPADLASLAAADLHGGNDQPCHLMPMPGDPFLFHHIQHPSRVALFTGAAQQGQDIHAFSPP
ncbi:hypothetical protein DSCA_44830 [Desulfosarcina alkanivorans]|uniref:Uncharacterized protein n=1 Tax=Desulfosarcina alkanivorans TaxID=571177 RepID=A0A5K7YQF6_9BACT|nr:hypothetical protein DSCA_44830 [Desulfosarcina alkanivorans]